MRALNGSGFIAIIPGSIPSVILGQSEARGVTMHHLLEGRIYRTLCVPRGATVEKRDLLWMRSEDNPNTVLLRGNSSFTAGSVGFAKVSQFLHRYRGHLWSNLAVLF
jgi:hypothetical protein